MSDCVFCRIISGEIPSTRIYADDAAVAFLDIAPFKPGHTLVVAREHVPHALASASVLAALAPAITQVGNLLVDRLGADGMNILTNVNEVSGQSVFHLHVHLIPRFASDPGMAAMLDRDPAIDNDEVRARLLGA